MPRPDYKTCKSCGKHTNEVGVLSHRRLCYVCALERCNANNEQISQHSGPWFNHWRHRIAASVGAVPLDATRTRP